MIEGLPLYKKFSEQQIKTYKPFSGEAEEYSTKIREYQTPFMYDNVDVGDFYEIDACKGIEFKADTGFITITEDRPIVAVTVVGSGCVARGYNIVEWWKDDECVDDMKSQLVKRQRVDNLNGMHPSIWLLIIMKAKCAHGPDGKLVDYDRIVPGEVKDRADCLKKLSAGFYEGVGMGFYENTAHFRVGPPYPHKVTVRCGCKEPEDPGTSLERYPGDYAIRVVETLVMK